MSKKRPQVYNITSYMRDEKGDYTEKDAREDVKNIADNLVRLGRGPMIKVCLTIVACSAIKTAGRVIIAKNYAKKG